MSARLDLPAFGAACLNSFSSNEMRIAYLFFGSAGLPRINGEINVPIFSAIFPLDENRMDENRYRCNYAICLI